MKNPFRPIINLAKKVVGRYDDINKQIVKKKRVNPYFNGNDFADLVERVAETYKLQAQNDTETVNHTYLTAVKNLTEYIQSHTPRIKVKLLGQSAESDLYRLEIHNTNFEGRRFLNKDYGPAHTRMALNAACNQETLVKAAQNGENIVDTILNNYRFSDLHLESSQRKNVRTELCLTLAEKSTSWISNARIKDKFLAPLNNATDKGYLKVTYLN